MTLRTVILTLLDTHNGTTLTVTDEKVVITDVASVSLTFESATSRLALAALAGAWSATSPFGVRGHKTADGVLVKRARDAAPWMTDGVGIERVVALTAGQPDRLAFTWGVGDGRHRVVFAQGARVLRAVGLLIGATAGATGAPEELAGNA